MTTSSGRRRTSSTSAGSSTSGGPNSRITTARTHAPHVAVPSIGAILFRLRSYRNDSLRVKVGWTDDVPVPAPAVRARPPGRGPAQRPGRARSGPGRLHRSGRGCADLGGRRARRGRHGHALPPVRQQDRTAAAAVRAGDGAGCWPRPRTRWPPATRGTAWPTTSGLRRAAQRGARRRWPGRSRPPPRCGARPAGAWRGWTRSSPAPTATAACGADVTALDITWLIEQFSRRAPDPVEPAEERNVRVAAGRHRPRRAASGTQPRPARPPAKPQPLREPLVAAVLASSADAAGRLRQLSPVAHVRPSGADRFRHLSAV